MIDILLIVLFVAALSELFQIIICTGLLFFDDYDQDFFTSKSDFLKMLLYHFII